jgi:putative membrane protein
MTAALIIGLVFGSIAALLHLYIFVLESFRWMRPSTWKTFGLKTQDEAETTRALALNQGFYNLFLAIGAGLGIGLLIAGNGLGYAFAFLALGSMVAASLVLLISNPKLARSAAIQGTTPLIAVVALAIACAVQ